MWCFSYPQMTKLLLLWRFCPLWLYSIHNAAILVSFISSYLWFSTTLLILVDNKVEYCPTCYRKKLQALLLVFTQAAMWNWAVYWFLHSDENLSWFSRFHYLFMAPTSPYSSQKNSFCCCLLPLLRNICLILMLMSIAFRSNCLLLCLLLLSCHYYFCFGSDALNWCLLLMTTALGPKLIYCCFCLML